MSESYTEDRAAWPDLAVGYKDRQAGYLFVLGNPIVTCP